MSNCHERPSCFGLAGATTVRNPIGFELRVTLDAKPSQDGIRRGMTIKRAA